MNFGQKMPSFGDFIQIGVLIVMIFTWLKNNKNEKIKVNAQTNMEMDRQLKDAMKKLANAEGDINDVFELHIDKVEKDYLKEDVYDVISILNSACYYYKKTNRDISNSDDFWTPRFAFFAHKRLFQTAFDKYTNLNYEDSMYKMFKKRNYKKMSAKVRKFYEDKLAQERLDFIEQSKIHEVTVISELHKY